jgi:hypothetical protein
MDVDIEGDLSSAPSSQPNPQRILATKTPTTPDDEPSSRVKRRATKRAVFSSDEDSGDEYNASQDVAPAEKDDEWDAPKPKEKDSKPSTPVGGAVRSGKGILSTRIPKKKTTKDDKPITFKDESKVVSVGAPSSQPSGSHETESKDTSSKSGDTPKEAPKRKLPTIPKKKPTTVSSSSLRPSQPDGLSAILQNPSDRATKLRKMHGNADLDLSNSSLYNELFKVCLVFPYVHITH